MKFKQVINTILKFKNSKPFKCTSHNTLWPTQKSEFQVLLKDQKI